MAFDLPLVIEAQDLHQRIADDNLLDKDVRIIDLSNPQNYAQGHVPGAIQVLPQELVAGTPPAPGKLPSIEQLERLFSRLGLTPNTHFVVYDDEGGGWAGRFIWTLDMIGHPHYSYLNGGLIAWHDAELPLSQEGHPTKPATVNLSIKADAMMEKDAIIDQIGSGQLSVWDARTREEYDGVRQSAQKNGHIPGAIHCEWTELMDRNAALRIRTDAKDYLLNKGFALDKTIVTHCHTHHRSGFTYLVGKTLGLTIKAYPGSWSEWGNSPDTPVET